MDSIAMFRAALESEKGALGPSVITSDPAFVEAAGYAGNVAGVCPVVRVPRSTDIWIDRALDVEDFVL